MTQNQNYWMNEGVKKTFTHSLSADWLAGINANANIIDIGCGYGRLTPELQQLGFTSLYGYDFSHPLIERAKQENPGASYTTDVEDLRGRCYDLVICFALFTCCPSDTEQSQIVSLIDSITQDCATLYISDYETGDNPHYNDRYDQRELNLFGCFRSGAATFRHHDAGHFGSLLEHWNIAEERTQESRTLNGNPITIHQYLYTKKQANKALHRTPSSGAGEL
ncbi:MAG: class I SAM-dependent methyltransferase [Planctomycetes bacterium]|nr:class I SAM-dependent methyltransferase [Planctomycetota bacterium]